MSKKEKIAIPPSGFAFLAQLRKNNNREWFNEHKAVYQQELLHLENFASALLAKLNVHDVIATASGKQALNRIYRDTRFSPDKTPYKTHWSGHFTRATAQRRGGYYLHIEEGNTFLAGGFFGPSTEDLRRIRDDIAFDPAPLRKILQQKTFVQYFETLRGEQLKTAPKGYAADHEAIDLLRYKQFLLRRSFTDAAVLADNFLDEADKTYKAMRPFLDYMTNALTVDGNGA